jgi:hypothetical protein
VRTTKGAAMHGLLAVSMLSVLCLGIVIGSSLWKNSPDRIISLLMNPNLSDEELSQSLLGKVLTIKEMSTKIEPGEPINFTYRIRMVEFIIRLTEVENGTEHGFRIRGITRYRNPVTNIITGAEVILQNV